jgi:hypothetical protein
MGAPHKVDESELVKRVLQAPEAVKQCATRRENADFYKKGGCEAPSCPYQNTQYSVQVDGEKLPSCMRYHNTLRKMLNLPPAPEDLGLTPL